MLFKIVFDGVELVTSQNVNFPKGFHVSYTRFQKLWFDIQFYIQKIDLSEYKTFCLSFLKLFYPFIVMTEWKSFSSGRCFVPRFLSESSVSDV